MTLPDSANRKGKQNWHQTFEIPENEDLEVFSCQYGSGFSRSGATLGVTAQQVCLVRNSFGFAKLV